MLKPFEASAGDGPRPRRVRQHVRRPGGHAALRKAATSHASCSLVAAAFLVAGLAAAYALDRGHERTAASAHPGVMAAGRPMPAAARCGLPAGLGPGSEYEWSNSIGAPAAPLPSWWFIPLPTWPTRT